MAYLAKFFIFLTLFQQSIVELGKAFGRENPHVERFRAKLLEPFTRPFWPREITDSKRRVFAHLLCLSRIGQEICEWLTWFRVY
jgi:hypothetical protein